MKIRQIAKITDGQDGAIWKNELFRFNHKGECFVYDLRDIKADAIEDIEPRGSFRLDKEDIIVPHNNSVSFGTEFFAPDDEYPLLYSNIYNNYENSDNKLIGVCCVYRLQRTDRGFQTMLVQLIEIGFVDDPMLWKAYPDRDGVRPYGNFVVDCQGGYYYAFVMRDETLGTRYFKFKIPSLCDGEIDLVYGVRKVVLTSDDILEKFDCPYHRYIQGATAYNNCIYSAEGFEDEVNRPAIRVIDLLEKREKQYVDLWENGYRVEPEMIDFYNGECYYSDAQGNIYTIDFNS